MAAVLPCRCVADRDHCRAHRGLDCARGSVDHAAAWPRRGLGERQPAGHRGQSADPMPPVNSWSPSPESSTVRRSTSMWCTNNSRSTSSTGRPWAGSTRSCTRPGTPTDGRSPRRRRRRRSAVLDGLTPHRLVPRRLRRQPGWMGDSHRLVPRRLRRQPCPIRSRSATLVSFTRGLPCGSPAARSWASISFQWSSVTSFGCRDSSHSTAGPHGRHRSPPGPPDGQVGEQACRRCPASPSCCCRSRRTGPRLIQPTTYSLRLPSIRPSVCGMVPVRSSNGSPGVGTPR